MQAYHDTTFESRLAKLDLTRVMAHAVEEHGLTAEQAQKGEELYRKFLMLHAQNPDVPVSPPQLVDNIWHTHMTFSRQYMADCEMLFGSYFHHDVIDQDNEADWLKLHQSFARTEAMFKAVGVDLTAYLTPADRKMSLCCGD